MLASLHHTRLSHTVRLVGLPMTLALALAATGCASHDKGHEGHEGKSGGMGMKCEMCDAHMKAMKSMTDAVAVIRPTAGNNTTGWVRFSRVDDNKVKVIAHVEGLPPNSSHGFHIHEFGDATAPDAMSTGSHFDPAGTGHHGKPEDATRHGGDMGNLTANAQGVADLELTLTGVSIAKPMNSILGRAVIVHAKTDDFGQPTGNAGGRIGVGVIGLAKGPSMEEKK